MAQQKNETIYFGKELAMYSLNGHDKKLVEDINRLHSLKKKRDLFNQILTLIANRDIDELQERDLIPTDQTEVTEEQAEALKTDILTDVCDDQDLEAILAFCHYDPKECQTRFHIVSVRIPKIGLIAEFPVTTTADQSPLDSPKYLKLLETLTPSYAGGIYTKATELTESQYEERIQNSRPFAIPTAK